MSCTDCLNLALPRRCCLDVVFIFRGCFLDVGCLDAVNALLRGLRCVWRWSAWVVPPRCSSSAMALRPIWACQGTFRCYRKRKTATEAYKYAQLLQCCHFLGSKKSATHGTLCLFAQYTCECLLVSRRSLEILRDGLGCHVIGVEYPGYGLTADGEPSEDR